MEQRILEETLIFVVLFIAVSEKTEYGDFSEPFPPFCMHQKSLICHIKGCGKATKGRSYCEEHGTPDKRRTLSGDLSKLIRSACCKAECKVGDAHEYGEQYCKECGVACCWTS